MIAAGVICGEGTIELIVTIRSGCKRRCFPSGAQPGSIADALCYFNCEGVPK